MIPVGVLVTKYQANGGKIFDTAEEAIHYEKLQSGERKECPHCKGTGKYENRADRKSGMICNTCQGKGWLEKKKFGCNNN